MNRHNSRTNTKRSDAKTRGFTLIELMIAMLLGLIVIAGVSSIFLANLRSYKANTALSDVQTNARIAFELMARDIRQAGLTGCNSKSGRVSNVLANGPNNGGTAWYANWDNAVRGYDGDATDPAATVGTSNTQRVTGTDSLEVLGAVGTGLSVAAPSGNAANFKLNETSSDLQTGDIIMVCDPDHSVIVQITKYTNSNVTVVHNTGEGSPGNCSKGLGYPTVCGGPANGNSYTFGKNSSVFKMGAHDWYIGHNPVGGKSLYRVSLSGGSPTAPQEMVRNVTNMQITYHVAGKTSFSTATNVAANAWGTVDAVHIAYALQSKDQRAGTDQKPLTRNFATTIALRNRT